MMCPQCGLPVSPARTSCPRCGIPVEEMIGKSSSGPGTPFPSQTISSTTKQEEKKSEEAREKPARLRQYRLQPAAAPVASSPPSIAAGVAQKQARSSRASNSSSALSNLFLYGPPRTRLGFTVAGICIGTGALILIVVFIIAQSLPRTGSDEASTAAQHKQFSAQVTAAPTPSPVASPTVLGVTPTPSIAGSSYIDNVQIGTTINTNPVAIAWSTTQFKVGQRIYITMNVNRVGYQGAVCLDWYVENAFLTHYAFSTTADPSMPHSTAWSYAVSMRQGPGYVNVFWASSLACADKVLAQRVDFNVTG